MKLVSAATAVGAILLSSHAFAKAEFVCGTSACTLTQELNVDMTAIDDLRIDGHLYDVTFSTQAPSSSLSFGEGIAAAKQIDALYGTIPGNPILASTAGFLVTSFAPSPRWGSVLTGTYLDVGFGPYTASPQTIPIGYVDGIRYADFTPVSGGGVSEAPEIDPKSIASAITLLVGGLVMIRGRRRTA